MRRRPLDRVRRALARPGERALLVGVALLCAAWEPLWRNQPDIADGIEAYQAKKWKEAQGHFEQAAKEIPDTPELHLNRGAALYQQALAVDAPKRYPPMNEARDEFQRALGLDGVKKAAAWHNLATSVTQLALLPVKAEKDGEKPHDREERMNLCKTAIDGFKKALELAPEDVDTKFNLEVAQRLLDQLEEEKKREEEQKKKQEEQQKKDQKQDQKDQKNDQNKDQQNKDQQKQDQQNKDQQKQDQQKQDQQKQDQQNKDQQKQDQQKQDQQKQDQQKQDQQKQTEQQKKQQEEQKKREEQQKAQQQAQAQQGKGKEEKAPPLDLAPLEALKNSEKPLQLYRIMMDPGKSRVNVKKDW